MYKISHNPLNLKAIMWYNDIPNFFGTFTSKFAFLNFSTKFAVSQMSGMVPEIKHIFHFSVISLSHLKPNDANHSTSPEASKFL